MIHGFEYTLVNDVAYKTPVSCPIDPNDFISTTTNKKIKRKHSMNNRGTATQGKR